MFRVKPQCPWWSRTLEWKPAWVSPLIVPTGSGPYAHVGGEECNHHPGVRCKCAYYRKELAGQSLEWTCLQCKEWENDSIIIRNLNVWVCVYFIGQWNNTFWGFNNWDVHCCIVQWTNQVVAPEKLTVHTPLESWFNFGDIENSSGCWCQKTTN